MQTLDSDSNIRGGQNCMDNESICARYACTSSRRVQVLHCHDSPTMDMSYMLIDAFHGISMSEDIC